MRAGNCSASTKTFGAKNHTPLSGLFASMAYESYTLIFLCLFALSPKSPILAATFARKQRKQDAIFKTRGKAGFAFKH